MKGGFVYQRHNNVRDMIVIALGETCDDVQDEPQLQPLTGENLRTNANARDNARLDTSVRDFWRGGQHAFFNVGVLNSFAQNHLNSTLPTSLTSNEKPRKRQYNQHVIETEHGSFILLVFSPCDGCGREAEKLTSELAANVSGKRDGCV